MKCLEISAAEYCGPQRRDSKMTVQNSTGWRGAKTPCDPGSYRKRIAKSEGLLFFAWDWMANYLDSVDTSLEERVTRVDLLANHGHISSRSHKSRGELPNVPAESSDLVRR